MATPDSTVERASTSDWIVRLVKGVIIGMGAIIPGLSGGVLAVVFGIYEPLVRFVANLKDRFVQNLLYFLPVGIGLVLGVFVFSAFVDFAFTSYAAQFIWLFIGFVSGTFPALYRSAGKQGREPVHYLVLALAAVGIVLFLRQLGSMDSVAVAPTLPNWVLSGALIGLGVVIPGMSPSNFLIYLGLYQLMAEGILHLDSGVIIPLALGLVVCVLALAKVVAWAFQRYYAFMYHAVLGIVVGSTLAIIPSGVTGGVIAVCALLFAVGAFSSWWLAKLDERHPHQSII